MPKIPVIDANLTAEERKARQFEHDLGHVLRALMRDEVESAARAYVDAVKRGGDVFLELCQGLPAKERALVADLAKLAGRR